MSQRRNLLVLIDVGIFLCGCAATRVVSLITTAGAWVSMEDYVWNIVIFWAALFGMRLCCGVYAAIWRYADSKICLNLVVADLLGGVLAIVLTWPVACYIGVWQSVVNVALFDIGTLISRFMYQQRYRHLSVTLDDMNKIGVAIVGAGQTGAVLAKELQFGFSRRYHLVCFIDKDEEKIDRKISGVKVYRENEEIIQALHSMPVQEIFIALPDITSEQAKRLYDFYSQTGCAVKLYDFPIKDPKPKAVHRGVIREINIEDLLFRDSLKIGSELIKKFYEHKVILVTGGGGSIGSEICRQIAKQNPAQLIIFDIYENNAYNIQQELLSQYGSALNLEVEIGSVRDRDRDRLAVVFQKYAPQVVFHAAAHKHVPLMEKSCCEAIKNNVVGTYNTADMAERFQVERFVLISTDKAVNPTNIMGASKRMCEMVVQCRTDSKTTFTAVRFGNVLGSNGSVVPLFQKQIAEGGPITLTDKRIIRYFMTIPEASQLVMRAGAMAKRGELFVLDMGKPVKILDLAENMIRLSGYRPYQDIDIVEIGLRPGEKLYEELMLQSETLHKTKDNMIFIEHDEPLTRQEVECRIALLQRAVSRTEKMLQDTGDDAEYIIREAMRQSVPTYRDPQEVNQEAEQLMEQQLEQKDVLAAV